MEITASASYPSITEYCYLPFGMTTSSNAKEKADTPQHFWVWLSFLKCHKAGYSYVYLQGSFCRRGTQNLHHLKP